MVGTVTMKMPSKEYLDRRKQFGLQALGPLHHYIMDHVFEHFCDYFTTEDVIHMAMERLKITQDASVSGNPQRVRLLVIRALKGMESTKLIEQSGTGFRCSWSFDCEE